MTQFHSPSVLPVLAQDVAFRYGRLSVLRGVSLQVRAGEIWALVGANGAGKTTLFSVLSGMASADKGTITFGEGRASPSWLRARIAVVTHQPQAYGQLSARENLDLYYQAAKQCGHPCLPVQAALERFGLTHAADRLVQTFSRGMAQRVALARAFSGQPDLYLLDEPFTALDRKGKTLLAQLLREESARGAAVMLASHDLAWICELADRVAWLDQGSLREQITLEQGRDQALATMRGWIQGETELP